MRCRVVCALRETIEILLPIKAFVSVDLPTFGRPTTAIKPQWYAEASGCGVGSTVSMISVI
jgi:hypothetical protein